jgi:hypothetical protein
MKTMFRLKTICVLAAFLLLRSTAYGQLDNMGAFLASGVDDAQTLLLPYLTPAVNAFGAGLGSGWYNTAEPHKLGGFDITFSVNTGIIPKKYETYEIDNSSLNFLQLQDPTNTTAPTISGDNEYGPMLNYKLDGYTGEAFQTMKGMNVNYVPMPMVQAGIGLIKGTEVMVRYLPNIQISDNEVGLWGLGIKHDIKQWIPGLKRVPVFNMSIMYGFTKLHTFIASNVTPDDINAGSFEGADASTWENQEFQVISQSQTGNLVVSANLPVVCFYGGAGFIRTKTNLRCVGDYPMVAMVEGVPVIQKLTDPIDMEFKNKEGGITKPRLNAGVRFKLAILTIHFDYSWANYSVLSAGLGFSFR